MRLSFLQAAAVIACAVLLAGCDDIALPPDPVIVQATVAEITDYTQIISLTGVVAARATSNLSFKTSGRVLERRVNVGDRVTQGQVLALLDPQEQQADMASAQAGVDAANAKLRLTTTAFARQESLIASGSTTRRERDQAEEDLSGAHLRRDPPSSSADACSR